ncbi:hypothetical protein CIK05_00125 [Bdellovibrio sp. qaytius]|nr:hypothetical protein CIK05_00125 [Bdellovibrio sp. qaytius]
MKKNTIQIVLILFMTMVQGCADSSLGGDSNSILPDTAVVDPANPTTKPPTPSEASSNKVLLFNGQGISTSDWQTTQSILKTMRLETQVVNSAQLEQMTVEDLKKFALIIVPGGHSSGISSGLTGAARVRVRQAVRDYGVSYLGICAGAWAAVGTEANTDTATSFGFAAIYGSHLANWWPDGNTNAVAAVVPVQFADGKNRQLVWYGGPATPEWAGGVVARYSNGKAAISQAYSGKGFVVLTGPHPEAPQGWRNTAGYDSDGLDYDIAQELITSALTRTPMAHY